MVRRKEEAVTAREEAAVLVIEEVAVTAVTVMMALMTLLMMVLKMVMVMALVTAATATVTTVPHRGTARRHHLHILEEGENIEDKRYFLEMNSWQVLPNYLILLELSKKMI